MNWMQFFSCDLCSPAHVVGRRQVRPEPGPKVRAGQLDMLDFAGLRWMAAGHPPLIPAPCLAGHQRS